MRLTEEEYNRQQARFERLARKGGDLTERRNLSNSASGNAVTGAAHPTKRGKGQLRKRRGMNKTEAAFSKWLDDYPAFPLGFEAITLRMPGGTRYTPDFPVVMNDGALHFYETKGFLREAARVRLKEFAAHFGSLCLWKFFLVRAKNRALTEWVIQEVG